MRERCVGEPYTQPCKGTQEGVALVAGLGTVAREGEDGEEEVAGQSHWDLSLQRPHRVAIGLQRDQLGGICAFSISN